MRANPGVHASTAGRANFTEVLAQSPAVRVLFFATVAYAGVICWLSPRPPMIDMPQHAGQIAALRHLLQANYAWGDELRLNFLTPYLLAYGAGLALTLVMPVAMAIKTVLTLAFYASVAAWIA